jgi:peptide-methionine (S)-S-oxide reductase
LLYQSTGVQPREYISAWNFPPRLFVFKDMEDLNNDLKLKRASRVPAFWRPLLMVGLALGIWAALLAFSGPQAALSAANETKPTEAILPMTFPPGKEVATFAGGCFWAMQAEFSRLKGVDKIDAGYAGGHTANPTYGAVCSDTTGYAETVQVVFDPKVVSYHDLMMIFLRAHNPTTLNRQGNDIGNSYRSAIFYHSSQQKAEALKAIAETEKSHVYASPIVTQVVPYTGFHEAEAYHQNYFAQNPNEPYCQFTVAPEVARFESLNKARLK